MGVNIQPPDDFEMYAELEDGVGLEQGFEDLYDGSNLSAYTR